MAGGSNGGMNGGMAGASAGTAGAEPPEPCVEPRDDCDRNASCQRVDGVDRCVCNEDFFGDGMTCDGPRAVQALAVGDSHACAIVGSGRVRCWGDAAWNALGTGDKENDIGDDEPASAAPFVDLPEPVRAIASGDLSTCVLFMGGGVRCWGYGADGQLGNGEDFDSTDPTTAPNVDLGGKAVALSSVSRHVCALLEDGAVRCWGQNNGGELGYGNDESGGLQTPATSGDVDLDGPAVQISATSTATCAVLEGGTLTCWGYPPGIEQHIGDDETPRVAGVVDVGVGVKSVAVGSSHTCVVTVDDNVRCWGQNSQAELGYSIFSEPLTLSEMRDLGDVDVGGPVKQVVVGNRFTCALLTAGTVRCWGYFGGFAYGSYDTIGDNETPAETGDAPLGGLVSSLSAASDYACAVMESGELRCFGKNQMGRLGYGNVDDIGDDETPASVGDVPLF